MKRIRKQDRYVTMTNGVLLHVMSDVPPDPKAMVLLIHGSSEHAGRYDRVVEKFNAWGYGVWRYDIRGHGLSGPAPGALASLQQNVRDAEFLLEQMRAQHPGLPVYTLSHSYGCLVAVGCALKGKHEIRGQILMGMPLVVISYAAFPLLAMTKMMNAIVPRLKVVNANKWIICSDRRVRQEFDADPLTLKEVTIRYCAQVVDGMLSTREHLGHYSTPCLILHGEKDRISLPDSARYFYEQIKSPDKTMHIYPRLWHEILFEKRGMRIVHEIGKWMDARI